MGDRNQDGNVSIDEFVCGLVRLTGTARSQDLLLFIDDQREQLAMLFQKLDATNTSILEIRNICKRKSGSKEHPRVPFQDGCAPPGGPRAMHSGSERSRTLKLTKEVHL